MVFFFPWASLDYFLDAGGFHEQEALGYNDNFGKNVSSFSFTKKGPSKRDQQSVEQLQT